MAFDPERQTQFVFARTGGTRVRLCLRITERSTVHPTSQVMISLCRIMMFALAVLCASLCTPFLARLVQTSKCQGLLLWQCITKRYHHFSIRKPSLSLANVSSWFCPLCCAITKSLGFLLARSLVPTFFRFCGTSLQNSLQLSLSRWSPGCARLSCPSLPCLSTRTEHQAHHNYMYYVCETQKMLENVKHSEFGYIREQHYTKVIYYYYYYYHWTQ